jgi:uncharacterized membrane protein
MGANYREINYALRPAKNVERKMFCEAFHRLSPFAKVDSYRYVGLGSTYFSDFILFHKALNLRQMISIEEDGVNENRFTFNKPYNCVKLEIGHSNVVLPRLKWDCRSIVWLDFTAKMKRTVIKDIALITSKISSGSVLLVTLNADPETLSGENEIHEKIDLLKSEVGVSKVPADLSPKSFAGWGTANVYRNIINNQIEETLAARNGVLPAGARLRYKQVFFFHYEDGAMMMTTGGVFYDEGQELLFNKCGFHLLDFYRDTDVGYKIEVPCLTFKEIHALDKQLPRIDGSTIQLPDVPDADILKYEKIYRYFPSFTETSF